MSVAFVLGNGKSRLALDLAELQEVGPIYGCNALYRTFTPNCLIATDPAISKTIQESGYSKTNRFHTRRPIEGSGAKTLPKEYKGFSSGPNALAQACIDGYHVMYLIGFDLGTTDGQFNNVYADTEFYKKITDPPTFSGNWIKQIKTIAEDYNNRRFIRVEGKESSFVPTFRDVPNLQTLPIDRFKERLNSRKGLL
jgi:hypothetical protein